PSRPRCRRPARSRSSCDPRVSEIKPASTRGAPASKSKAPEKHQDQRSMNLHSRTAITVGLLLAGLLSVGAQTKIMNDATNHTERATFGGGCFWCTEAISQMLPGVKSVASGYAGGAKENPTYREVCTGTTGHAEVIQVEYDPKVVSYEKLLETFWQAHDPTTLNHKGNDHGTQYRSIILYNTDAEKAAAEKSKAEAQKQFKNPIVTEIVPLKKFYKAEGYHQDYFRSNP